MVLPLRRSQFKPDDRLLRSLGEPWVCRVASGRRQRTVTHMIRPGSTSTETWRRSRRIVGAVFVVVVLLVGLAYNAELTFQAATAVAALGGVWWAREEMVRHDPLRAARAAELVDRTKNALVNMDAVDRTRRDLWIYTFAVVRSFVDDPSKDPTNADGLRTISDDLTTATAAIRHLHYHSDPAVADLALAVTDAEAELTRGLNRILLLHAGTGEEVAEHLDAYMTDERWGILDEACRELRTVLIAFLKDDSLSVSTFEAKG